MEIIQEAWNSKILGSPSYIWESNLRATKSALKSWDKFSFKGPAFQKKQIQDDLASFQKKMEEEDVTMLSLNHEKYLNLRMLRASRKEEEELWMKSRQLWLKWGDNNTGYFHNQSKVRLSSNTIRELYDSNGNKIDGNKARGTLFNTS